MKLRNKRTGEIVEYDIVEAGLRNMSVGNYVACNSLGEFNEEWEDYEEPKKYWFIDYDGGIISFDRMKETTTDRMMKEIGNYFSSREEAEKAVEKLKAWKRLKDKGFKFTGINDDEDSQELITQCGILCEADIYHLEEDVDFLLLFGGEE
jgi:hypothetical protein